MKRRMLLLAAGIPLILVLGDLATARAEERPVPARYDLSVRVRPDDRRLELSGTVHLPAVDSTRAQVVFRLTPRMGEFRVEWAEPGSQAGNPIALERLSTDSVTTKWAVRPAKPVPPNTPVTLRFSAVGSGDFAQLWYVGPEVALGSAWGADWYPVLQGDVARGVGTLGVSVPPGWSVVASGVRRSTAAEEKAGTFRVAVDENPTYFTFLAGPYITVRRAGAVPLSAHVLSNRENMPAWLEGTERMLDVLVAEFGPYAFDSLAFVEVPRDIAQRAGFNAFSAQGVLALNHRAFGADPKRMLEWLGHEMAHQWFPHVVQFDTPPGYFMEETMAEYGGLRIVETLGGPGAATRLRRTGFEHDPIYSALAYFRLVGAGNDAPIGNLEPREHHRNLAYTKGALVFDMLSRELGHDTFRRILNDISRRHAERRVPWPTFLEEIERGAGRDLDWFYEQWFQRTGAPDFALTWSQDGDQLRGRITQPAPFYRARLTVEARGTGKDGRATSATHVVAVDGATADFTIRVPFRATAVELDPAYEVLRWTPEYREVVESARAAAQGK